MLTKLALKCLESILNLIDKRHPDKLQVLEGLLARKQGKGWGYSSTDVEAKYLRKVLNAQFTEIRKPKIFDIGANNGQYIDSIIKEFESFELIAFEPSKQCFDVLEHRFTRNRDIKVVQMSLGKSVGKEKLYYDRPGSTIASHSESYINEFSSFVPKFQIVDVTTLDNYCSDSKVWPDVIKIDVEGFEMNVLLGAQQALEHAKVVQFEFGFANVFSRTFFHDFYHFFANQSFSLHRIAKNGLRKVNKYSDMDECFRTTNYLAVKLEL